MVTTFNKKDMESFGSYLLSKERKNELKKHPVFGWDGEKHSIPIPIEDIISKVHEVDFHHWKGVSDGNKWEYYVQKQDIPKKGSDDNNPNMESMGALGWELCGIHDNMYIYKRRLL